MRTDFRIVIGACCGMILFAPAAIAKHLIHETVKRNVETAITDNFCCGPNCSLRPPPAARLVSPPKHGKVQQIVVREILSAAKLNTDQRLECEGRLTNIRYIIYKSTGRYVGPDSFRLEWIESDGNVMDTYSFRVK